MCQQNEYSIFKHVLRRATNMANQDKAERHLLVFHEANKVHFTVVRNGKTPSMTFQMWRKAKFAKRDFWKLFIGNVGRF